MDTGRLESTENAEVPLATRRTPGEEYRGEFIFSLLALLFSYLTAVFG